MRKNFKQFVALSMSVLMIGTMIPTFNVKAEDAASTTKTINSEFINGDFEKGLEPWQIMEGSTEAFEVIETDGGNHVLQVSSNSQVSIRNTAWYVKELTEYTLKFDVKIEGEGSVFFNKYEFKADWSKQTADALTEQSKLTTTNNNWKTVKYTFKSAVETGFIQVDLKVNGTAQIDNVMLYPKQQDIVNVDFGKEEADVTGWTGVDVSKKTGDTVTGKQVVFSEKFDGTSTAFQKGQSANSDLSAEKSHSGANSLKCVAGDGSDKWSKALLNVWYGFTPNTEYTIAGWVYVDDSAEKVPETILISNSFAYNAGSKWGLGSSEVKITNAKVGEWVYFEEKFTTPSAEKSDGKIDLCQSQLCVRPSFDVTVYFDDIEIFEKGLEQLGTITKENYSYQYDFEGAPTGFAASDSRTKNVSIEDVTFAHSGNKALHCYDLTNTQTAAFFNLYNMGYDFAIQPNKEYTLRYYVYVPESANIPTFQQQISVNVGSPWATYHSKWQLVEGINEKGKWNECIYKFTITDDAICDCIQLTLYANGETEFYIDDVSVFYEEEFDIILEGVEKFGQDGGYALKLDTSNSVSYNSEALEAGKTYEYSYDVKVEDAKEGFLFTTSLGDESVTENTDWITITGEFVAGDDGIVLNRTGEGTVYFDNLVIEEKADIHIHHGKLTEYEATCEEAMKRVYTCDDCTDPVYTEVVGEATGHDFSVKVKTVAPTYTEKGYTVYKCSHCDKTENKDYVDVLVKKNETTQNSSKLTKPAQVKNVKVTAKKKSLKVTWKKVSGAKKYQVQISLKKNFKKSTTYKTSKATITIKKLKAKKKYYVRVRALNVSGKKTATGKWSKVANKKTK